MAFQRMLSRSLDSGLALKNLAVLVATVCCWGLSACFCYLRPDLLDLANDFANNAKSWGHMRALERSSAKQPWRKALPEPFQSLAYNSIMMAKSVLKTPVREASNESSKNLSCF